MLININNDFLCANIFEDQAQWRDRTKGLSNLVIIKQCARCRLRMDDDAKDQRRICSFKADRSLDAGGMNLYFLLI